MPGIGIRGVAETYEAIGANYRAQKRYAEALEAYRKALVSFERLKDPEGLVQCYHRIGKLYLEQARPEEALPYYQKALSIQQRTGDQAGLS